jgi:hypothetical protein
MSGGQGFGGGMQGGMGRVGMMNRGGYGGPKGQSVGSSGIPPWANQNGGQFNAQAPDAPNPAPGPSSSLTPYQQPQFDPAVRRFDPYSGAPSMTPWMPDNGSQWGMGPGSGQPNRGGPSYNPGLYGNQAPGSSMPRTGGLNTVTAQAPMDSAMPKPSPYPSMSKPYNINDPSTYGGNKPMMLGPQTGGNDYATGGMDPRSFNPPNPSTFMQQSQMQTPAAQAPQSWEQQNSQLLRPAQMQDPALAAQDKAGGQTLQSIYPNLTPQQLAQVNRIGSDPVGAGGALSAYLISLGYPAAGR